VSIVRNLDPGPELASTGGRTEAKAAQARALPDGPTVVSCSAPVGSGGLGHHLEELIEALRAKGSLAAYLSPRPADASGIRVTVPRIVAKALTAPPLRFSSSWRVRVGNAGFDLTGARALPRGAEHLLVFNGHAARHAAAARRLGYESVGLISANSHLAHVARQHEKAWRQYPIERPWSFRSVSPNLKEYERVDSIYVSSRYAWESFTDRGVAEERLRFWPLTAHPRYEPRAEPSNSDVFTIVYVGSLTVHKGVPVLLDAVRRLPHDDMRLILIGGAG
jgi:glycosyltransferase involved in cell wall biosynthesis